ncbi:CRISPR-associated protein Csx20 [Anaerobranca gottschalkii]|uniref:Uncharacterized protein n=1 Tax=Anaerobranca gottschalkii DSM 13577 TaxID=1120990 RepID=A0A1I0C1Q2_9FIRM|nr:CRISPR-associated protein Csx20 [Anaerobranca gottschalkii]SET13015.1 hypothetical protein SAMN03080614_105410 [Anaerobranca gottschalkii DSM 13577]
MKALVITSHRLNDEQILELQSRYKVEEIIYLPEDLQNIWSNIEPSGEFPIDNLKKIVSWISKEKRENVFVIVQGEFGATFLIVDYCLKNGYKALYATSKRQVKEEVKEGETHTIRVFKHVNFREYKEWKC